MKRFSERPGNFDDPDVMAGDAVVVCGQDDSGLSVVFEAAPRLVAEQTEDVPVPAGGQTLAARRSAAVKLSA